MIPTTPLATTDERMAALFDNFSPGRRTCWWRRPLGMGMIAVVILMIAGGTVGATQALGSTSPRLRTALVGDHDVSALMTGVATVEPVSQATVAFPVSGTVASVAVAVGDQVGVGQSLATLDTAALVATLHTKQAALAQAELILTEALAGDDVSSLTGGSGGSSGSTGGTGSTAQTTAATTSGESSSASTKIVLTVATLPNTGSSPSAASGPSPSSTGGASPSSSGSTSTDLTSARQAVATAQHDVDTALAAASAALASATTDCATTTSPSSTSAAAATSTATAPSTTTTTAPAGGSTSTGSTSTESTSCESQLNAVLAAQTAAAQAQATLASATTALDDALATVASSSGSSSTPTTAPASESPSTKSANTTTGTTPGNTSTASTPSSADLIKYQQSVDAAFAEAVVAEQGVAQATIVTPIAGTVLAVNLTAGDSVAAASSTADVVIAGSGGYEASLTVGVDKISKVKIGQAATVTPDGSTALQGKVVAISIAADPSATTTSYRVTIGIEGDTSSLHNGGTASVAITTSGATSALAVPTSAVTTTGTRHTVKVVTAGVAKTEPVKVGAVGTTWTQITAGLTAGQRVEIADLDTALPDSATSSSTKSASTTNGRITTGFVGGAGGFTGGPPSGAGGFGR